MDKLPMAAHQPCFLIIFRVFKLWLQSFYGSSLIQNSCNFFKVDALNKLL